MNLQTPIMTAEAFDEFVLRPENSELLLEYIAGEISEVVSNTISSEIAGKLVTYIGSYLWTFGGMLPQNRILFRRQFFAPLAIRFGDFLWHDPVSFGYTALRPVDFTREHTLMLPTNSLLPL